MPGRKRLWAFGRRQFFWGGRTRWAISSMGSASAMTDCTILRIHKKAMIDALHREHSFSDLFVSHLWQAIWFQRTRRSVFNSSEKRWREYFFCWLISAKRASRGRHSKDQPGVAGRNGRDNALPRKFFINRFRKLGFVEYDGSGMHVPAPYSMWCYTTEADSSCSSLLLTKFHSKGAM